jgi:hypothetical protein
MLLPPPVLCGLPEEVCVAGVEVVVVAVEWELRRWQW